MAIMDFFKQPVQQVAQQVAKPAVATTGQTVTPEPAGDGGADGSNKPVVNPMDAYNKMWEDSGKNTEVAPSFSIDPTILGDVAGKMDFMQGVPQELMAQATSGDASALMKMMNLVGQNSYKAALSHTSSLTDKFVGSRLAHDQKNLGSQVKTQLTNAALADTLNYNHPVVKNELNRIANQISSANPDYTAQQVANEAKKYLTDLTAAISPPTVSAKQKAAEGEMDWTKYMTQSNPDQ